MSSKIVITNIKVQNNPAKFLDPIKLSITLDALNVLKNDLHFQIIYVGSAENEKYDQILDNFDVPIQ